MKTFLIASFALSAAFAVAGSPEHRLIVVADPQVYQRGELDSVRRAAADIRRTASDGVPTVGIVLGDIVGEMPDSLLVPTMEALAESGIEFRYVVGNHDLDTDTGSNRDARRTFRSRVGPTWYSFELGGVHCVVLDDVFMISRGVARYVGYIEEEQLDWLKRDLEKVPAGSTLLVCLHIPTWSRAASRREWGREELNKVVNNRESLYRILEPYRVHILAGHEHYQAFYTPVPHIEEHVHAPLSTYFWRTALSMDGIPAGYSVYETWGDSIEWYFKAVDHDRSRQFSVERNGLADTLTVNVWNWDTKCRVDWWENGLPRGAMTPHPTLAHRFVAVPRSAASNVRVEFRDRFGRVSTWNSGAGMVAHRGLHTDAPENSLASFRAAQGKGFYASEADFYVTADDAVVSFHDTTVPGFEKPVEQCTLRELRRHKLENGERLPLFEDYIEAFTDPKTKLIVEIKTHTKAERNRRAADLITRAVKEAGLAQRVEYIAFDYDLCKYLAAHPNVETGVGYLNGDRAPAEVHADGIDCVDYNQGVLWAHPEWIEEAHRLGLTVNVWTVNDPAARKQFKEKGVDLITTDYPQ